MISDIHCGTVWHSGHRHLLKGAAVWGDGPPKDSIFGAEVSGTTSSHREGFSFDGTLLPLQKAGAVLRTLRNIRARLLWL